MNKFDFSIVSDPYQPFTLKENTDSKGYIRYGNDNKYPERLYNLYIDCSAHQAIIDNTVDYVLGDSLSIANIASFNQDEEDIKDVLKDALIDYKIYGGFAIQVIYNKLGNISRLVHLDFMRVRVNKDKSRIYYCDEFNKYGSKPVEFEAFNPTAEFKTSQVLYVTNNKGKGVYPIPDYSGGIAAIETMIEIQRYHLNSIRNSFNGTVLINFNNGAPATEEAKKEIENKVIEKFCGTDNANKVLISFNESKDNAVELNTLEAQDVNSRYAQLEEATNKNLFISHRVTSPALMGLIDKTGFNSTEYLEAFDIFNRTVIKPLQRQFIRDLSPILQMVITPITLQSKTPTYDNSREY